MTCRYKKYGLLLMVLSYWAPLASAEPAADAASAPQRTLYPQAKAASSVEALPSPEEDYQAAKKADAAGDLVDAGRLFLRAARRGHAAAQAQVGYTLRVAASYKAAAEWLRKAAEQGDVLGQRTLSTMYAEGEGLPQDFAEARKWLTKAAEQGDKAALNALAAAYAKGGLGLDEQARNGPDALVWIKRAADLDDVAAIEVLADAYRSGRYGLQPDPVKTDELEARRRKILGIVEKKTSKKKRF